MFRRINVNSKTEFKFYLYRNRFEVLGEIHSDWVKGMTVYYEDINSIDVEIPKYIMDTTATGAKRINSLYLKVKPRQQIIVEMYTNGTLVGKERYTIDDKKGNFDCSGGKKKFTAHSFESTLNYRRVDFNGTIFQLKNDGTNIADGILDIFIRENPDWKLGSVDDKSRRELSKAMEVVNVNLLSNFSNNNITDGGLIFETDVVTTIADNKPLNLSIQYNTLKTFSNGTLLKQDDLILNNIDTALPKNIKHVKAYHYSDVGNRYGIKYVFTLSDNTEVSRTCPFTNVINKSITCDKIVLAWETGNIIEYNNVKYITIDNTSSNWYKVLRDVQDQFTSVFIFDSYNKTISVVHRDNIGEEAPFGLSYDNSVINIETTEESEYITGLHVTGKDGLSLSSENIYGGDIIYDFSWYKNNGIMSDELVTKWTRYEAFLTTKLAEWQTIKDELMSATQRQTVLLSELNSLKERLRGDQSLLVGYMKDKDGTNQARIKSEIDALETSITNTINSLASLAVTIQGYNDDISKINNAVQRVNATDNIGQIFSNDNLAELGDIELIDEYSDEYYTTPLSLCNNAKLVLADKIKPQISFKITCANLCKIIQNPIGWNGVLTLGNWFRLDIDDEDLLNDIGEDSVRLTGFKFYPSLESKSDKVEELIFTNKTKRITNEKKASDIGRRISSNSTVANSFNQIKQDSITTNNYCKNLIDGELDASATSVRGRNSSNLIDISNAGIFLYDSTDTKKACYIGCGLYCLTTDGFATANVAITPDGITAEMVAGKLMLGNRLLITNDNGSFTIEGTGLTIRDGNSINGDVRVFLGIDSVTGKATLKLMGKDGQVVLDESGILQTDTNNNWDNVSNGYPITSYIPLDDGVSRVKECLLTVRLGRYRGFTQSITTSNTTTTTGQSNTTTTSSSASHRHLMFKCRNSGDGLHLEDFPTEEKTANYLAVDYGYCMDYAGTSEYGVRPSLKLIYPNVTGTGVFTEVGDLYSYSSDGSHNHSFPHFHYIDLNLSTSIQTGIKLFEMASNVSIKVNGQTVVQNINNDTTLDITSYIKLNTDNKIEISSNTNGRIDFTTKCKYFCQF